ncbi:MAG: hypothetical protein ACI4TU_04060 [Candidatus Cryptobacteroides sp.]
MQFNNWIWQVIFWFVFVEYLFLYCVQVTKRHPYLSEQAAIQVAPVNIVNEFAELNYLM